MKTAPPRIRPRRWLREGLLGLALATEASWLTAWSIALGSWTAPPLAQPAASPLLLIVLLLLGTVATRLSMARWTTSRLARFALAAVGLALALLTGIAAARDVVPSGLWTTIANQLDRTGAGLRIGSAVGLALIAWWRGIAAGRNRLTREAIESCFHGAILALVSLFLLNALAGPAAAPSGPLVAAASVALFASLVALPLARIVDLSEHTRYAGAPGPGIRRQWLAILVGTVIVLLLTTFILARIFTFQRIDALTRPLAGPADALLWALLYVIAVPIGFLIQGLVELFRALLHPGGPPRPPEAPAVNWVEALRAQVHAGAGPPALLVSVLKWSVIAVLAALILLLLGSALFRLADWRSDDGIEETRDFVISWAGLRASLLRALRSLRARPLRVPVWLTGRPRHGTIAGRLTRDPRALYRELLRLGAHRGRPRAPGETPYEYQPALDRWPPFDQVRPELRVLTEVYVQARYSDRAPPEGAVQQAVTALDRVREAVMRAAEQQSSGPLREPSRAADSSSSVDHVPSRGPPL